MTREPGRLAVWGGGEGAPRSHHRLRPKSDLDSRGDTWHLRERDRNRDRGCVSAGGYEHISENMKGG